MFPKVPFKYREIWKILDKKAAQKPYQGQVADKMKVLVAGAGPCGLRTAIEAQLLGAKVSLR
jgi:NADPH-dependent 2,4-dienoyl-CoA reductase/sulfur reductase-like enzyme